jgi:hypothetical protein
VTLARLPLKKFAKQFFPVGVAHRYTRLMAHEGVEVASLLRFLLLLGLYLLQHVFGHAKPSPAGYRGCQIYVAPFRIGRNDANHVTNKPEHISVAEPSLGIWNGL